jgi:hypothetical protein
MDEQTDKPVVEAAPEVVAPAEQQRGLSRGKLVRWGIIMVVVGACFGLVIVAVLKYIVNPVEGVVVTNGLSQARASVAPKAQAPNELGGLLIEFKYPAIFDSVSQVKTDAHAVEQYNITSRKDYRRGIAVNVRELPAGGLSQDSGYRFREVSTQQYRLQASTQKGDEVVRASKLDRQEATVFWVHGQHLASVSVTAMDPDDDVEAMLTSIMATLRWRK